MNGKKKGLTRRGLLKQGAVAAAGAAGLLTPHAAAGGSAQPPAVVTRRKFRAWISRGDGRGRTTLQEVTFRPISGRQVVVRTESTNLCYSNVSAVLGLQPVAAAAARLLALAINAGARRMNDMAVIQGHGGIGIVEAVGPEVRRVRAGDRVCVSGTPQCGSCYHCLRGRSDMCQFLSAIGAGRPDADSRHERRHACFRKFTYWRPCRDDGGTGRMGRPDLHECDCGRCGNSLQLHERGWPRRNDVAGAG